ncbi:T9SS type A sorting domain-containing protein [Calditrichota bacterium]
MTKKILLFTLTALFLASPIYAGKMVQVIKAQDWRIVPIVQNELDELEVMYFYDFEDENIWESVDQTAVGAAWHTSDNNAYNDGESWWCADEDIEGYNNHWLQYLEAPSIDLTDAGDDLALTFMMYLDCEETGGEPVGYDGWDGANVWYSTDGGETWAVLADPDPAYGSESLYSFGEEFGMDTGIPGWDGDMDNEWTEVTFSLGDFTGEADFMLRFAFCADPGVATPDEGFLGFFVDEILVSDGATDYLENNAEDVAEPSDLTAIEQIGTGDNWTLQEEVNYSDTHAWHLTVGDNLLCAIVSPEIEIPDMDDWPATYMTYYVYCNLLDSDGEGNNSLEDYYQIEATTDGVTWQRIVYDYGYDNGSGNSLEDWVERTNGLESGGQQTDDISLTRFSGETIRLRFSATTDDNDDGGVGEGLFIDDVSIISTTGLEWDIAVNPLSVPYPITQYRPVDAIVKFINKGNNQQTFNAYWQFIGSAPDAFGNITLDPQEEIEFYMDADPNDDVDSWIPYEEGRYIFFARHLAEQDENATNNSASDTLMVLPAGQFELGYGGRNPEFQTSRFAEGEGPLMHFEIPEDLEDFVLDSVKYLWNGDFNADGVEAAAIDLYIFAGGDAPGAEIYTETFIVDNTMILPNWHVMVLGADDDLSGMTGDYWVWIELSFEQNETVYPHPVYAERYYGDGVYFDYDGTELTDSDTDWMFRLFGGGTSNIASVKSVENSGIPLQFALNGAYPNPFNPNTTIKFDVARNADVSLIAYNINGQAVANILNRSMSAGSYTVDWNAANLASGMYFLQMEAGDFNSVRKVILLK